MKTSVNAVLSFMVGEYAVEEDNSPKKLEKLKEEMAILRRHLPLTESTEWNKGQVREANRLLRMEVLMEKCPEFKGMEESFKLDSMRLAKIITKYGEPNDKYFEITKKMIDNAKKKFKKKTIEIDFGDENSVN